MVNQQFTFAVHIMTALAFEDEMMDSRELAASVNTNPVVVRRLLQSLRRAKLIETHAGKHGGARLRRKPGRISLLDIYDAVECPSFIAVSKRRPSRECPVSCNMKAIMTSVAENAERALRKHLADINLKQLVRKIAATG